MQPKHLPCRRLDRDAPVPDLMLPSERRPEGHLKIWYFLYRFYDADKQPLYFGVAADNATRWGAHRKRSPWWSEAEYVAISVYGGWDEVRDAERATVRHERPRCNKQGIKWHAAIPVPLGGTPEQAAYVLLRQARPDFVRALGELLTTQPLPDVAPPAAWD